MELLTSMVHENIPLDFRKLSSLERCSEDSCVRSKGLPSPGGPHAAAAPARLWPQGLKEEAVDPVGAVGNPLHTCCNG